MSNDKMTKAIFVSRVQANQPQQNHQNRCPWRQVPSPSIRSSTRRFVCLSSPSSLSLLVVCRSVRRRYRLDVDPDYRLTQVGLVGDGRVNHNRDA